MSSRNDGKFKFCVRLKEICHSSMPVAVGTSALNSLVTPEALENAAKEVDRQLAADRQYPELAEQINASQGKIYNLWFFLPVMRRELYQFHAGLGTFW